MNPRTLTDEELTRDVYLDDKSTERERELARRLELACDYISEIEEILIENNLAEIHTVSVQ
jgi:hypothetical protein